MKKFLVLTIAILSLSLLGAGDSLIQVTGVGWPACSAESGAKTFREYVQAIISENTLAESYYENKRKCGQMKSGIRAEIVKEGNGLILVRIHPEGMAPAEVFMIEGSLEEEESY